MTRNLIGQWSVSHDFPGGMYFTVFFIMRCDVLGWHQMWCDCSLCVSCSDGFNVPEIKITLYLLRIQNNSKCSWNLKRNLASWETTKGAKTRCPPYVITPFKIKISFSVLFFKQLKNKHTIKSIVQGNQKKEDAK